MKNLICLLFIVAAMSVAGQSEFSQEDYKAFLQNNKNLSAQELLEQYPPQATYYSSRENLPELKNIPWFDSINATLKLTKDEKELLKNNYFLVTERQNSHSWLAERFCKIV